MKTSKYQRRFYRDWIKPSGLYLTHVIAKETDVEILTNKPLDVKLAEEKIRRYRWEIENYINKDSRFLVSLKAGGTGLNLVGADTVIHYDMWWNPAVESQATDRVHRMGQKNSVSSYKLITLGTIEEKIAEMQKRKKGLVKKVVSCDDEAIAKLTWEDVLELLKT